MIKVLGKIKNITIYEDKYMEDGKIIKGRKANNHLPPKFKKRETRKT